MSGRQHAQAIAIDIKGSVIVHGLEAIFSHLEALTNQAGSGFRAQDGVVPGEVIGMGVRDECPRARTLWIEPKIDLRKMESALVTYFDQIGAEPNGSAPKLKASNGQVLQER